MRTNVVILCGLFIAAPFLHAAESENSRFYLTPSVEYMFMGNLKLDDGLAYPNRDLKFKDTPGLSLEGGFHLTPKHVLKFETGYFKTETETPNHLVTTSFYGPTTAELEIVPLLIGYKYCHKINNQWQLHIGVSQGGTILWTKATHRYLGQSVPGFTENPRNVNYTSASYAYTFGGDVGMDYNLTDRAKLSLGVKCRAISGTEATTHTVTTSVNLGYKFCF